METILARKRTEELKQTCINHFVADGRTAAAADSILTKLLTVMTLEQAADFLDGLEAGEDRLIAAQHHIESMMHPSAEALNDPTTI